MDERLRFVARLFEGERWRRCAPSSAFPARPATKSSTRTRTAASRPSPIAAADPTVRRIGLPVPIEATIVRLKREYPAWGAPKIREKLRQQVTGVQLPAISTVHAVLDRYHLVKRRRRRRRRGAPAATTLTRLTEPNALWCADYKGEFMLGNRGYCYPPTITDFASLYLLTCETLSTTREKFAFTAFDRTLREFGLPATIHTDNGVPFASPTAHSIGSASSPSAGSVWGSRSNGSNGFSPASRSKTAGTNACTAR
jgi:putative transposase